MPDDDGATKKAIQAAGFVMVPVDTTQPAAISLRDWLAGMWICGSAAHHNTPEINTDEKAQKVVQQAYRIADAMLAERRSATSVLARRRATDK